MVRTVLPGKPYPQGATWDGTGVNFSIYSEGASEIELWLFEDAGSEAAETVRLKEVDAYAWHCYLPGIKPGQLYGYRIYGPYSPESGCRFNPAKLSIDPYGKAVAGTVNWDAPVFPYKLGSPSEDLCPDGEDDAWGMPKSVVVAPYFDWEQDRSPGTPLHESVIYEVHVKSFTACRNDIPPELRGTYAGLAARESIEYLKNLGVTAVELMPVHAFLDDKHLVDRGLRNYWGYNTISFFSPDARYSSVGDEGDQVGEFKQMVKELHRNNIEVILDVVYNHTAEGNHMGPSLSFRGVDNATYYRLVPGQRRYYMDYTGCGNTLNVTHPQVLKLIMDSLRYWIEEMHVDGFRFDLAAALARELHDVNRLSAFFDIINQDPVISRVKLIAEPWDVGDGGYQVGNFPALWAEWNGRYRDTVRRYWKGDSGQLAELGFRITGSSDLYKDDGRKPSASINFITAHDGFPLRDLVSYNDKHNEANGEDNRDGTDDNHSWNHGIEGDTGDPEILELRYRQMRNFLATLFFSQGVPMILGGDEIGRSQRGNNNAYCQDNELNWYDWKLDDRQKELLEFTKTLIALRKKHPNLRRKRFFQGTSITPSGTGAEQGPEAKDITWLRPDGQEMTAQEWDAGWVRCLGFQLGNHDPDSVNERGEPVTDDILLVMLNPHHEKIEFYVPRIGGPTKWEVLLDTRSGEPGTRTVTSGAYYDLIPRSCALLRMVPLEQE